MYRRRSFRMAAALAVCSVVAACGSTVQRQGTAGSSEFTSAGPAEVDAGPADEVIAGVDGSATPGSAATATGETASAPTAAIPGTSTAKCTTPVKLGVSYSSAAPGSEALVGGDSSSFQQTTEADLKKMYQRTVDDLNSRGGLGGCPAQLVFYGYDYFSSESFDQQSQAECTSFAEDQKVFAVFASLGETEVLADCLAKRRIPLFYAGQQFEPSQEDYRRLRGFVYLPWAISADRFGPFINIWKSVGYFDNATQVGILVADDGSGQNQRLVERWKPELAKVGFPKPEIFTFSRINGYPDVGRASAAFKSAVLRFKAANVSHVLFTPDGGNAGYFFTLEAENQQYRPRYGSTTASFPASWTFVTPEGQRPKAVVLSYDLRDFLTDEGRSVIPATATRAACERLYKANNMPPNLAWCDTLETLRAGLKNAAGRVTPETLLSGVEALGGSHISSTGFGPTLFGPGRYDAQTRVMPMTWKDTGSKDWTPMGAPVAVP